MSKLSGASDRKPSAFVISPESPYPTVGGGPLRTASLLEYLAQRYEIDMVTFHEQPSPDPRAVIPERISRQVHVVELPFHSRSVPARALRNVRRYVRGAPPLVDRFGGFDDQIRAAASDARYELGVIEHFWCASYLNAIEKHCDRVVLNLHNIESVLADRCAIAEPGVRAIMHRRFAAVLRDHERELLPRFSTVLVPSESDAEIVRNLAGKVNVHVYPNALPLISRPQTVRTNAIVFSGNLEYEPNRTAVSFFSTRIWPRLRERFPQLRWRIVGKNPHAVAPIVRNQERIELVGPVPDAVLELSKCVAAVAPLTAGSGTRIKIIEAWAAGVPVVSTTVGAEGLPYRHGEDVLIADTPEDFCEAVSRVLASNELQLRLGANGRATYERELTWPVVWQRLQVAKL